MSSLVLIRHCLRCSVQNPINCYGMQLSGVLLLEFLSMHAVTYMYSVHLAGAVATYTCNTEKLPQVVACIVNSLSWIMFTCIHTCTCIQCTCMIDGELFSHVC